MLHNTWKEEPAKGVWDEGV